MTLLLGAAPTISGMGADWRVRRVRRVRVRHTVTALAVALAFVALGQAIALAVAHGFVDNGAWVFAPVPAALYGLPLCLLAVLSTLPLMLPPVPAALLVTVANLLMLVWFPPLTVAGGITVGFAAARLGARGELRVADLEAGAQLLAVGLGLPFLVVALVSPGNVAALLLAALAPVAGGAGIAVRSGRQARTYSAGEQALAGTLLAHTARGERARIARELHDVVAHHISMIAVLAETGRLATPGLPEAGARRFAEIGQVARAGLTEMRRLLGVLRDDAADSAELTAASAGAASAGAASAGAALPGVAGSLGAAGSSGVAVPASRRPQPGLTQLAELIDSAREASATGTRLIISGPVAPLDPGVELAAYRIVQEALTNARRHAAGAAVDVELRYGPDELRVRVRDNGPGAPGAGVSGAGVSGSGLGGHGLLGMRERALSVGGSLSTGAAPGGGFLVEASLPAGVPDRAGPLSGQPALGQPAAARGGR